MSTNPIGVFLTMVVAAAPALAQASGSRATASSTSKTALAHPSPATPSRRTAPAATPPAMPSAPLAPSADGCNAPDLIAGTGLFTFDNGSATTGVEGQAESACNQQGAGSAIARDVWFRWQATMSGVCTLSTCGHTSVDTKVAVYAANACPTSAAIACNDDNCGGLFQSTLVFPVTGGASYVIQLGNYPGQSPPAAPGAGLFSITVSPAAVNDDCHAPSVIAGTGIFQYDTTNASTGIEGQGEAPCLSNNQTGIEGDAWFRWTAAFSGVAAVSSCNGVLDSKMAVYPGGNCPAAGTALACNDDGCGFVGAGSRLFVNVSAGQSYMVQVGQAPGSFGASSSFEIAQAISPSNDDCAAPASISGNGPHAFDDTYATTGSDGQNEGACAAFGSTMIAYDVWFTWVASMTAQHSLSSCGNTIDTKVAIYAGTGCPAPGSALACNDDRCGVQSELCFVATAGMPYTIQIGTFPFGPALGGVGSFTVVPLSSGIGNDECIAAVQLGSALGPFAFDTTSATTGCEGQTSGACFSSGTADIDHDVWFTWVAPQTSGYTLSTCGSAAGYDTRVGVYDGAGCPSSPAIACNDDGPTCAGLESEVCFSAVSGATYTLQIGNYPSTPGGPGTFTLTPIAITSSACSYDDGTSENSIGWPNLPHPAVLWLQRFGASGDITAISTISTAFGSPTFLGGTPGNGAAAVAALWDDPNDDGDPSDCVLLASVATTIQNVDTDVLNAITLGASVTCPGVFFVGVGVACTGYGQFPAPLDQDGCPRSSAGRAWIAADQSGTLDLQNLSANSLGLREMDAIHLPGVWLLRADCLAQTGTPYCFGDGSGAPCPCSPTPVPNGAPGHGCPNSNNPGGALLSAVGTASLSADSVVLIGSGMPSVATCLYFQGTTQINATFGDGRRCVGGSVLRLATRTNSGGSSQVPSGAEPSISARAASYAPPQPIGAGQVRTYQCWYRNAQVFCVAAATYNLTNGLSITWQP